uniref:Protein zer-1 homolog n=1 Tax=Saccoglossus kowalevskii TaxID=10224 RepID=A0ABM0MAU9_SACKO|nr:PREDICTED: protein zer-1 homolog [Saccoglossus kowalevskii]
MIETVMAGIEPDEVDTYSPDSLLDITCNHCLKNPQSFCNINSLGLPSQIRPGVYIPLEIAEKLVNAYYKNYKSGNLFLSLFCDTNASRLQRVCLQGCQSVSEEGLKAVCQQDLVELDISETHFEPSCLSHLQHLKPTLQSLNLHGCDNLMNSATAYQFQFTNLRVLDIGQTSLKQHQLHQLIKPLLNLTSIDLSEVVSDGDLTFLDSVLNQLRSLVLFDCKLTLQSFHYLCQFKALRHLDISQDSSYHVKTFPNVVPMLLQKLQTLVSLDVSGTDLLFPEKAMEVGDCKGTKCNINAFKDFNRKLEFLGLLDTDVCEEPNLPAVKVSGGANENQILISLKVYMSRCPFISKSLDNLFDIVRGTHLQRPSLAVTTMITIIKERLEQRICDEVMEIAWSTLWNVTDETSENCKMFLDGDGMQLFLSCLSIFKETPELLRNMMGLMGNVAEVEVLRPQLVKYTNVFSDLLDNRSDGIEVSYNAAGVISHIAFDGAAAWNVEYPSRQEVLSKMVKAIESWDLQSNRNINYRSFEPILRLLTCYHTPPVQHWSVWALANLCTVLPERYCALLKKEGGCEILHDIVVSQQPLLYPRIKELAQITLDKVSYADEHEVFME